MCRKAVSVDRCSTRLAELVERAYAALPPRTDESDLRVWGDARLYRVEDGARPLTVGQMRRHLAELRAKGMQINELPASESARMRSKLSTVNTGIAANVGQELWNETQAALAALRK
jgi:hypothetical protein